MSSLCLIYQTTINVSGKTNNPDCHGLTPDELSRFDFSKMDFSQIINDIRNNTHFPDTKKLLPHDHDFIIQKLFCFVVNPYRCVVS
ncbi:hypothetical protein [Coxiella-like endosymbiont of Rhipicephalus sanguineus]|uniref:hypothetical protein n=1 Tax=Coxiella-like endosymbiont of Rhipicephalus sanguineus TaxID=1955402 RepID=UPI00203C5339|nr:hypothetical protein [Coxiella-like endosymbiont of Rhipicephalus sanguineus]